MTQPNVRPVSAQVHFDTRTYTMCEQVRVWCVISVECCLRLSISREDCENTSNSGRSVLVNAIFVLHHAILSYTGVRINPHPRYIHVMKAIVAGSKSSFMVFSVHRKAY